MLSILFPLFVPVSVTLAPFVSRGVRRTVKGIANGQRRLGGSSADRVPPSSPPFSSTLRMDSVQLAPLAHVRPSAYATASSGLRPTLLLAAYAIARRLR